MVKKPAKKAPKGKAVVMPPKGVVMPKGMPPKGVVMPKGTVVPKKKGKKKK